MRVLMSYSCLSVILWMEMTDQHGRVASTDIAKDKADVKN